MRLKKIDELTYAEMNEIVGRGDCRCNCWCCGEYNLDGQLGNAQSNASGGSSQIYSGTYCQCSCCGNTTSNSNENSTRG